MATYSSHGMAEWNISKRREKKANILCLSILCIAIFQESRLFFTDTLRHAGSLYFPIVCKLFLNEADWIKIKEQNELVIDATTLWLLMNLKNIMCVKEAIHKRVYSVWWHIQSSRTGQKTTVTKVRTGSMEGCGLTIKGNRGDFFGHEAVLCLDSGGSSIFQQMV